MTSVVGRDHELEIMAAVLAGGGNLVLEGPPGTSKTTLLRAITSDWGVPLQIVEGNADLTPSKLVGYHDPAGVLQDGYLDSNFIEGPLILAMRSGGILYVEELNRAPAETLNTLLTAIGDGALTVPRLGLVRALPTFRVVASMNPFDNVGTHRLSPAVHDRLCRLSVTYQDAASEREIVLGRLDDGRESPLSAAAVEDAVALTRATRHHGEVRVGSSVRGAIDLTRVVLELARARGVTSTDGDAYRQVVWSGMLVALSGRMQVDDASERTPEAVLAELWSAHFGLDAELLEPG